jgi:Protein of unknown function (DUF2924)
MDTRQEVLMEEAGPSNRKRSAERIGDTSQHLEQRVAQISDLDAEALQDRWKAVFRTVPSPNLSRSFMIRALAHRIQENACSALKPSARRTLDRVAEGQSSLEPPRAATGRAAPGMVLIRQWRGVTHRVIVMDNDVAYRGRRYKSLSEVARLITGTHWSGPMFFGLRNRTQEMANG